MPTIKAPPPFPGDKPNKRSKKSKLWPAGKNPKTAEGIVKNIAGDQSNLRRRIAKLPPGVNEQPRRLGLHAEAAQRAQMVAEHIIEDLAVPMLSHTRF